VCKRERGRENERERERERKRERFTACSVFPWLRGSEAAGNMHPARESERWGVRA
jgi:hypothetical protein